MGRLLSDDKDVKELGNVNAIIGQSGTGKSTLADAFGFIADCLEYGVEDACDKNNRGGFSKLISQGVKTSIDYEIYYKENSNSSPITYELSIAQKRARPVVIKERLRQRRKGERRGQPISFLNLTNGKGYAFKGHDSGLRDDSTEIGEKVDVELANSRQLGIVTLGELKEHPRIVNFKNFLK